MDRKSTALLIAALAAAWSGCADGPPAADQGPQLRFWAGLTELCGHAYGGRVAHAPPGDTLLTGKELVMHVRECGPGEIRIPFHVGDDRSRTWVLTRGDSALTLAHDHRHEDGSPAANTMYGGTTTGPGTETLQEFPADTRTAGRSPRTRTNVWSLALDPGRTFIYGLDRVGTDRRFRVEFDLADTVAIPPPPWGQ